MVWRANDPNIVAKLQNPLQYQTFHPSKFLFKNVKSPLNAANNAGCVDFCCNFVQA